MVVKNMRRILEVINAISFSGAPLSPDFFIPDGKYQDEFIQNDKRKKSQDSMKSVVSEADIQQVGNLKYWKMPRVF